MRLLMWVCVANFALTAPAYAQQPLTTPSRSASVEQAPIRAASANEKSPTAFPLNQGRAQQTIPLTGPPAPLTIKQPLPPDAAAKVDLERSLTKLADKLNNSLELKKDEKNIPDTIIDLLIKIATLVATVLGCVVSYVGLRKIPAVRNNSGVLIAALGAIVVLVLFYLLSGIVTSVLYVIVAILILLTALALAAAHLMQFIDEKYPEVKELLITYFSVPSTEASLRHIARDNVRGMLDWLSRLSFIQQINGEPRLELIGTLAEGFERSVFELRPNASIAPFWKNIDDRLLMPVMASVTFYDKDNNAAELVNIQPGLLVLKESGGLKYARFYDKGFSLLMASLLEKQLERAKDLLERQTELNNNIKLYNSQSV
jgi:hypothetical protein